MIKKFIPYSESNSNLEAFVATSTEQKRPLVILCHAWRGRDEFICKKAELIAQMGYTGFALDMYGKGVIGNSNEESAALKKPFIEDRAFLRQRLLAGYEIACNLPFVDKTRIAVLGYGFGGICALDLARSGVSLQGAITVYGHFDPPKTITVHPIKAKVLILHGYNDPIAPMSELRSFMQRLDATKVDWQANIYGNTVHAFATPSANAPDLGIKYNPQAAQKAWNAIELFLQELFE